MSLFSTFKKVNDKIGMVATLGGLILLPFFGAAASGYLAAQAAAGTAPTVAGLLTSFWAPLAGTAAAGGPSLTAGLSGIFNGWAALAKGGLSIAQAGFDPTTTMSEALASPFMG